MLWKNMNEVMKTYLSVSMMLWTTRTSAFYAAVPQMSLLSKTSRVFQTVSKRVPFFKQQQVSKIPAVIPTVEQEPPPLLNLDTDLPHPADYTPAGYTPTRRSRQKREGIESAARWLSEAFTNIVTTVSHDEPNSILITRDVRHHHRVPVVIMERNNVVILKNLQQ